MPLTTHDLGVASQFGRHSDWAEVTGQVRWLFTSGTPGLARDGTLPPDIAAQAEIAWQHIVDMLAKADMTVKDLVKVTQYLLRPEDIPAYSEVRARFLGDARPASMLSVVLQLANNPGFLLEIEAIAAKPS